MSAGRLGLAVGVLKRTLAFKPGDARTRRQLGDALRKSGENHLSAGWLEAAQRALRKTPP